MLVVELQVSIYGRRVSALELRNSIFWIPFSFLAGCVVSSEMEFRMLGSVVVGMSPEIFLYAVYLKAHC